MKPERILKVAAQVAALALLATSPLAQKAGESPQAPKAKPVASRMALSRKNGSTNPTPDGTAVARLRAVEGNVLLSQESGLSSVEGPVPLVEGARVITTAESKAVVVFNDGCEVKLEPNQRLEIESGVPCKERILLAQSIFLEPGGLALGAAATGVAGGVAGGAAVGGTTAAVLGGSLPGVGLAAGATGLAGFAALVDTRESSPASPN
jgi:hypothetical protein